jgi:hypothetical protein
MMTTTGSQVENPKSVFKCVVAFQPDFARASAEDAADATWEAEADRILRRLYSELQGDDPFERIMALMEAKLPPKPLGFHDHLNRCNRCGQAVDYCSELDASFRPKCNRWREDKCRDPRCQFCSQRPARPLP